MKGESLEEWRRRLRAVTTEQELLQLLGEYVGGLDEGRLRKLPVTSRPGPISSAEDLAAFTVQIARDELMFSGDAATRALMREMLTVLTEATSRLGQLSADGRPPSGLR